MKYLFKILSLLMFSLYLGCLNEKKYDQEIELNVNTRSFIKDKALLDSFDINDTSTYKKSYINLLNLYDEDYYNPTTNFDSSIDFFRLIIEKTELPTEIYKIYRVDQNFIITYKNIPANLFNSFTINYQLGTQPNINFETTKKKITQSNINYKFLVSNIEETFNKALPLKSKFQDTYTFEVISKGKYSKKQFYIEIDQENDDQKKYLNYIKSLIK